MCTCMHIVNMYNVYKTDIDDLEIVELGCCEVTPYKYLDVSCFIFEMFLLV